MDIYQTVISHYPHWSKIELIAVVIVMIISFIILERFYKKDKININTTKIESLGLGIQNSHYAITGSVFALTPSYFKYYNGLFSRTFLYVEELATLLLVHKAGLKTAIIDTDDVIHKGAASTSNELKSGTIKKKKMIAKSARKVMMLIVLPRFIINKL